jgi:superfamily II DNA or RNA helicase
MKNMSFRDKLQDSWASEFMKTGVGILHICPRGGKIRTSIRAFCKIQRVLGYQPKILICYPDKNIQQSWEEDFKTVGYKNSNIDYVTHVSLGKVVNNSYDIIVNDEIHLLSVLQKDNFKKLMSNNKDAHILGLSGTLSKSTEVDLRLSLGLNVLVNYTLDEAINDGIISDYRINVVKVDLDDKIIVDPKKKRTEKQKYKAISYIIDSKGQSLFLSLNRMRIVHNSLSKIEMTKKLLDSLKDKRVLVFCANNKVAQQLGIKIHTTKFKDQEEFDKYIGNKSSYNHMAVCKIGNTGVSFRSLDHIIINAFDSNSENLTQRICRSLILDAKNKVSNIYIVSSTEKVELRWLEKSLEFFDKKKIKYL